MGVHFVFFFFSIISFFNFLFLGYWTIDVSRSPASHHLGKWLNDKSILIVTRAIYSPITIYFKVTPLTTLHICVDKGLVLYDSSWIHLMPSFQPLMSRNFLCSSTTTPLRSVVIEMQQAQPCDLITGTWLHIPDWWHTNPRSRRVELHLMVYMKHGCCRWHCAIITIMDTVEHRGRGKDGLNDTEICHLLSSAVKPFIAVWWLIVERQ